MQVEQLMFNSIIKLREPNKYGKDKFRFSVSKILYKTQDTEPNTMQDKQSLEQFYQKINIKAMTDSRLCSQHDDCSLQIHARVSNMMTVCYCSTFVWPTQ